MNVSSLEGGHLLTERLSTATTPSGSVPYLHLRRGSLPTAQLASPGLEGKQAVGVCSDRPPSPTALCAGPRPRPRPNRTLRKVICFLSLLPCLCQIPPCLGLGSVCTVLFSQWRGCAGGGRGKRVYGCFPCLLCSLSDEHNITRLSSSLVMNALKTSTAMCLPQCVSPREALSVSCCGVNSKASGPVNFWRACVAISRAPQTRKTLPPLVNEKQRLRAQGHHGAQGPHRPRFP